MPPEPWYSSQRMWGLLLIAFGLYFALPACEQLITYHHTGYIRVSCRARDFRTVEEASVYRMVGLGASAFAVAHGLTRVITGRKPGATWPFD